MKKTHSQIGSPWEKKIEFLVKQKKNYKEKTPKI